jgi:CRP-like cAMP-binding protein
VTIALDCTSGAGGNEHLEAPFPSHIVVRRFRGKLRGSAILGGHRGEIARPVKNSLSAESFFRVQILGLAWSGSGCPGGGDRMPSSNRGDARALLAQKFIFGSLDGGDIDKLLAYARVVYYRAGTEIFAKGSPGMSLMAVLNGVVRISSPSASGREIVLNLIHPGEIFGEIALLDGRERTADAVAITDCELLVLHRRDFIPFLKDRADVCIKLIELLCHRLRRTSEQVEQLSFAHLESRIAAALLQLAREHDGQISVASPINLRITQRELGNMVGGSREHVNKQLQAWQKAGLIELGKGAIVIRDAAALARLL